MARSSVQSNPNLEKSEVAPEMQKAADEAADKGYYGEKVDPTPNEHYSLETGPDAPTPETDKAAAQAAHQSGSAVASRFPSGGKDGDR